MLRNPAPHVGFGRLEDNLPLGLTAPKASILDQVMNNQGSVCIIDQRRNCSCASPTVTLDIPFSQIGESVYRSHILECEGGGMMRGH